MPLAHSLPRSNWNTSNKRRRRNQGKEEKKRGGKRKVEIRRDLRKMVKEQGYRSLRSTSKMIDRRTMGNPKDPKGSQNHQDYQSHHNPGSRS
jgi:hypothetical protein